MALGEGHYHGPEDACDRDVGGGVFVFGRKLREKRNAKEPDSYEYTEIRDACPMRTTDLFVRECFDLAAYSRAGLHVLDMTAISADYFNGTLEVLRWLQHKQ